MGKAHQPDGVSGALVRQYGQLYRAFVDAPAERGKVFSMEAGKCISYDDDLGPGWNHITAVREKGRLRLHVNGKLAVTSSAFPSDDYDISNAKPLTIGFGEMDYFSGKIREVHVYNRALDENEILAVQSVGAPVAK